MATLGPEYPKTIEEVIAILESPEVANSETPSIIVDTVTISLTGHPYSESTLLGLAYSFEQATMFRMPPTITGALPGETFEYQPVPEPSSTAPIALFGLTALGLKLEQRSKVKSDRSLK